MSAVSCGIHYTDIFLYLQTIGKHHFLHLFSSLRSTCWVLLYSPTAFNISSLSHSGQPYLLSAYLFLLFHTHLKKQNLHKELETRPRLLLVPEEVRMADTDDNGTVSLLDTEVRRAMLHLLSSAHICAKGNNRRSIWQPFSRHCFPSYSYIGQNGGGQSAP